MGEECILEVRNLKKRFKKIIALDGIDLSVSAGETVVLMGPSGCGKSTLLRCINRLTTPDAGEIVFRGIDIARLSYPELLAVRRRIGFVFQQFNLIERLTVLQNVMLGPAFSGVKDGKARGLAFEALKMVGLAGETERHPKELSGGERQRVSIARALAMKPDLMLWDEPTASLDPILVDEILDIMEELASSNHTMIIVTHELRFASRVADRIIFIDRGRVVEEGPPGKVMVFPRSEVGGRYRKLLGKRGRKKWVGVEIRSLRRSAWSISERSGNRYRTKAWAYIPGSPWR